MGTRADLVDRKQAHELIESWVRSPWGRPRLIVTAYSEFYVQAREDKVFQKIMNEADLVTPDGVSVLAAASYLYEAELRRQNRLLLGLKTGLRVLGGQVGQTVTGIWLFDDMMAMAANKGYRVFILGGYGETAREVRDKIKIKYPGLEVGFDPGTVFRKEPTEIPDEEMKREIEVINKFKPEILFVAYGPVKQEKWLKMCLPRIKVKVAVGLGGTYDEFTGKVKPVPVWLEKLGLKWLGRLIIEPKRFRRMWRAFPTFPWLVYKESMRGK